MEDWTGKGFAGLRLGIVATPLPPLTTLLDDPLRILRSIRFAARRASIDLGRYCYRPCSNTIGSYFHGLRGREQSPWLGPFEHGLICRTECCVHRTAQAFIVRTVFCCCSSSSRRLFCRHGGHCCRRRRGRRFRRLVLRRRSIETLPRPPPPHSVSRRRRHGLCISFGQL
jgi:hypothetical protein